MVTAIITSLIAFLVVVGWGSVPTSIDSSVPSIETQEVNP